MKITQNLKLKAQNYNSDFKEKVLKITKKIPRGKTLTYRKVAELAGRPKAYRVVGNILAHNKFNFIDYPDDSRAIPCHRVIKSNEGLGGFIYGKEIKKRLLKAESLRGRRPRQSRDCFVRPLADSQ